MAAANSVDEYISIRNRKYIESEFLVFLIGLFFVSFVCYGLVKAGYPQTIYLALVVPLGIFFRGLSRRRKNVGKQIWNILCPSCNQYIALHQFECPPPCEEEYLDRSIIEGCPECNTRYKREGHDAFRYAICDNCGNKLDFSEPYEFKEWSVLSEGQTWDTETLVVKNDTGFSDLGFWLIVLGLPVFVLENLNITNAEPGIKIGIYVSAFGLLLLLIHKLLYGDTKRIPNPTFKRNEEPEEIYARNTSISWGLVLIIGTLSLLFFTFMLYTMIYVLLFLPYGSGPGAGERVTYSLLNVGFVIGGTVIAFLLILSHSIWYKEYKRVPNPEYKEDNS